MVVCEGSSRLPGDPAKGGRDGRIALSVVAVLIAVATFVGWMFHGVSLVELVLPDSAATAPKAATAPSASPTKEQRLYAWLVQVEPSIDALLSVRDSIAAGAADADMSAVRSGCEAGLPIVARIEERLPSPDPALNTALQQTLNDYRFGFIQCLRGIRDQDTAGIELAAVYLYRANADLRAVMAIIARDLGDFDPNDSGVVHV